MTPPCHSDDQAAALSGEGEAICAQEAEGRQQGELEMGEDKNIGGELPFQTLS